MRDLVGEDFKKRSKHGHFLSKGNCNVGMINQKRFVKESR